MEPNLKNIHRSAIEIAREGGKHTLEYFKKDIEVERKKDETPVTIADRETEALMREEIMRAFPNHGIIGEEYGRHQPESPVQWVLDPIDGTKSFIHSVPLYTTLIGILVEEEPVVGVIFAPALNELCEAASGKGTRLNGLSCSVRNCDSLAQATVLTTDVTTAEKVELQETQRALIEHSQLHRTWGDAYGHLMVAAGRADLMFDPELNLWDTAPLLPIVREAGGAFCDVQGNETIQTGNGISCSRQLLPQVLNHF